MNQPHNTNPDKVLLIFAMSRSGHHAIINWIQEQYPGKSYFYNHCYRNWENKQLEPHMGYDGGVHIVDNGGSETMNIYNIEEFCPFMWEKFGMKDFEELHFDENKLEVLFIVRDPYNLMASSYTKAPNPWQLYKNELGYRGTRTSIFEHQVAEIAGATGYITKDINVGLVSYNEWFSNNKYREALCDQLNIPFTDAGLQDIPSNSSFDSNNFEGKAQDMKVLERYKKYANDPRYHYCLSETLVRFGYDFFNMDPFGYHEFFDVQEDPRYLGKIATENAGVVKL